MTPQTSAAPGFQEWVSTQQSARFAPLFLTEGRTVQTHVVGKRGRRVLRRHPEMEEAVIGVVEDGLSADTWTGLVYIMAWGTPDDLEPLYIGMSRRKGRTRPLSANLTNLRKNKSKFARWGDGNAYHIGDLSQALFKWDAYKPVEGKYESWAQTMFDVRTPPRLRRDVVFGVIPWSESTVGPSGSTVDVVQGEKELIQLATAESDGRLLNIIDVPWWQTQTRAADIPAFSPQRPFVEVTTPDAVRAAVRELQGSPALGLDVETTLIDQRLCLIQVASPTRTFLFDAVLLTAEDLRPLFDVFEDERIEKVVHNASFERRILKSVGVELTTVRDTLAESRRKHGRKAPGGHGLAAACKRELGLELDKSSQCSDWAARPLSPAQLKYAAADAEVMLPLARRLEDQAQLPLIR